MGAGGGRVEDSVLHIYFWRKEAAYGLEGRLRFLRGGGEVGRCLRWFFKEKMRADGA